MKKAVSTAQAITTKQVKLAKSGAKKGTAQAITTKQVKGKK